MILPAMKGYLPILIIIFILGAYYGFNNKAVAVVLGAKSVKSQEAKATPTPSQPTDKEIINEIIRVFDKEPTGVKVKAIACFYSESKLKPYAINLNKNGTYDAGIAQINDVHKMSIPARFDFKKNIQKAYEIYLKRSWSAWYGAGCKKGY